MVKRNLVMSFHSELMFVVKRSGRREPVMFDKISQRIAKLCQGLDDRFVDPAVITQKVAQGVFSGVTTSQLDELAAETAAYMATQHHDYGTLAARIAISNLHKTTPNTFSECVRLMHEYCDETTKRASPLVNDTFASFVAENAAQLDSMVDTSRDFLYDYFGFKTLEKSYLLKLGKLIVERPQYMLMRVAVAIHMPHFDAIQETYDALSKGLMTHATPTLFGAGTVQQQLSSCFLLDIKGDSIEGIYDTLKDCAIISKNAGGIGIAIHKIRAQGSYIAGTNGRSNGIVPMLRVFNDSARYVDQGGGKRKGSIAMYLEPWHADVCDFLEMKKNQGKEEQRARDLFYALWVPDLFMSRVENNDVWSLFCPNEAPGLANVYGSQFEELYTRYEREGRARKTMRAQDLWFQIIDAQIETGTPYMVYKDACNEKSNQKNLGVIKSSNLCVSGCTLVTTKEGVFPIRELSGKRALVWNGSKWSYVQVLKTGSAQPLLKLVFSNKKELVCTPYHIMISKGKRVQASTLRPGDSIDRCQLPVVEGQRKTMENAWLRGQFANFEDCLELTRCTVATRVEWVNGLIESRLAFDAKDGVARISLVQEGRSSVDEDDALCAIALFNSLGVDVWLDESCLAIDVVGQQTLVELGVSASIKQTGSFEQGSLLVESVTDACYIGNTFCFQEPETQCGLFHGILTGNCTEIIEYTDPDETAVCNLASIALSKLVADNKFDFEELQRVTRMLVRNLTRVIDINSYPTKEGRASNFKHRPIGLGVQGLADAFAMLKIPFESVEAAELNQAIFETMYYAAVDESCSLAREYGPYDTFAGSPASQGLLQFDLWRKVPSSKYDWTSLKARVMTHGLRNSLLLAPMPTASTASILGNNESFEPFTSNLYVRRVLAGEFVMINKHLLRDLIECGLWDQEMRARLLAAKGSVQMIEKIPQWMKEVYKTVWEIKQRTLIDLAADRGAFICQSQSLNIFIAEPTREKMSSMHFYGWRKGLKTGMYYLRSKPKADAIAFTVEKPVEAKEIAAEICSRDNPEACLACTG